MKLQSQKFNVTGSLTESSMNIMWDGLQTTQKNVRRITNGLLIKRDIEER